MRISAAEMRGRNWTKEYKANERQESYECKHWITIRENIDKTNWAKKVKIRQQQVQAQMRESADRKKN
jgi:hypothetical protein